ncbi:reverse transcriptase [Phytophthora megakarya]|uniref:Reverse transcriptase n=1 Tax=Phytophthora megakarya TaxID=4795 RepID=A0A225VU14_9STRA|nr:reverse transcriptase [Phytophthora megakarya]
MTAAPSEREFHCEVQDDIPNLFIVKVFVEELLVLVLGDKFDMVLGMPWLARHDPIIDWEKRTVVRFGRRGATESDGPVSAADTPNGASDPPSETVARAAVSGRTAWSARAITSRGR